MGAQLLRRNFQPTDFADAECRVSNWAPHGDWGIKAYRVWVCRCSGYWFQRHEWHREGRNSTEMDPWIFSGYRPHKEFGAHLLPAPEIDED